MGTIVTTMVQTVEHYFMQFNTKTSAENRKSPIQVAIQYILYIFIRKLKIILMFNNYKLSRKYIKISNYFIIFFLITILKNVICSLFLFNKYVNLYIKYDTIISVFNYKNY